MSEKDSLMTVEFDVEGRKVNGTYTVTIVNNNKYGIHLGQLGQVEKSKVTKVGGTSAIVIEKETKKAQK